MQHWTQNHPLTAFFAVTFAVAFPLFALYGSGTLASLQFLLLILGSAAPAVAALIVSQVSDDRPALRYRVTRWRLPAYWYLASAAIPIGTWLVAALVVSLLGEHTQFDLLSAVAFPVIFFTNFLEEVGWRGFVLPHLLARQSALLASLALGVIWVLFHAPLYWQRPLDGVFFLAPIIPISIIITWLFIGSRGSVLVCTLFHAVFNTASLALLTAGEVQALLLSETAALFILALVLLARYGPRLAAAPTIAEDFSRP